MGRTSGEIQTEAMNLLENYLKREPLQPDYDYPTLEETALNYVIKLSHQCIEPIVSTIESTYYTAKEKIETSYQKTIGENNNKYNSRINQLQKNYQKQFEEIQKEYDSQKQILGTLAKDKKKEFADNTEDRLTHFRENYEYEKIMTNEVLEWGRLKKYQEKMVEIKKSVSSAKSELDELYKNTEQILSRYKISIKDKVNSPVEADINIKESAMDFFQQQREIAELGLRKLSKTFLPKIFLNVNRYIIAVLICAAFAVSIWLTNRNMLWKTSDFALILSGGLFCLIILLMFSGKFLRKKALSLIIRNFRIIDEAIAKANAVLDKYLQNSSERIEQSNSQTREEHYKKKQATKEKYHKIEATLEQKNKLLIKNINEKYNQNYLKLKDRFSKQLAQIEQHKDERQKEYKTKYDEKLAEHQKDLE